MAIPVPPPGEFDMLDYFHVNVGDPPRTEFEQFEQRLRQFNYTEQKSVSPQRVGHQEASPQRRMSETMEARSKKSYHEGELFWFGKDPNYDNKAMQRNTQVKGRIGAEKDALNEHQYRLHRLHDMRVREKHDTYGKGRGPRVTHQVRDQRHHFGNLWFGDVAGSPMAPHMTREQVAVGRSSTPKRPIYYPADVNAHPLNPPPPNTRYGAGIVSPHREHSPPPTQLILRTVEPPPSAHHRPQFSPPRPVISITTPSRTHHASPPQPPFTQTPHMMPPHTMPAAYVPTPSSLPTQRAHTPPPTTRTSRFDSLAPRVQEEYLMKQSRSNHVHSDHQYYARNKKAERQIMREVWTQQMQEKRERQLVQEAQGTVQPEERSWNGNKTKLVPGPDHYLYYDKVRELQDRVVDQAARRAVDERIMSGVEKRMTMFDR